MGFRLENPARDRSVGLCAEKCWRVVFACENGHGGGWSAADLAAKFSPSVTLEAIAARLKCSTCGSTSGGLGIMQDNSPEARERLQRKDGGLPGAYRSDG